MTTAETYRAVTLRKNAYLRRNRWSRAFHSFFPHTWQLIFLTSLSLERLPIIARFDESQSKCSKKKKQQNNYLFMLELATGFFEDMTP